jgi:hypothetical protein
MKKGLLIISIMLLITAILSGCSATSEKQKENTGREIETAIGTGIGTGNSNSDDSAPDSSGIDFEYFFRGFAAVKGEEVASYPHETCIIETDEDWHDFMDKYVPGVPYDSSVDYSKEYLVASILFPAKPSYSIAADIKTFEVNEDYLEPEYVVNGMAGISNGIYAQNTEDVMHAFVNIVKVKKNDIPENVINIYHKK